MYWLCIINVWYIWMDVKNIQLHNFDLQDLVPCVAIKCKCMASSFIWRYIIFNTNARKIIKCSITCSIITTQYLILCLWKKRICYYDFFLFWIKNPVFDVISIFLMMHWKYTKANIRNLLSLTAMEYFFRICSDLILIYLNCNQDMI